MKRIILYLLISLQISTTIANAQNKINSKQRSIIINRYDSVIYAYIFTGESKFTPIPNRNYYWFYTDNIHNNVGGYSGNLLNGPYIVLNNDKNMIEKGFFKFGLKTGNWKRWYPDGKLKSITNLKNGLLNGTSIIYSQNGFNYTSSKYKNGIKDGPEIQNRNDSTIKNIYKKGTIKKTALINPMKLVRNQLQDTLHAKKD